MISTPTQPCHNGWWAWVNTWNIERRVVYTNGFVTVFSIEQTNLLFIDEGGFRVFVSCVYGHSPQGTHETTLVPCTRSKHLTVMAQPVSPQGDPPSKAVVFSSFRFSHSILLKSHSSIEKGQLTSGPKRRCYGMVIHSFWKVISESPLFKIAVQNFRNKTLTTRDLVFHLLWAFSLYEKKSTKPWKTLYLNIYMK